MICNKKDAGFKHVLMSIRIIFFWKQIILRSGGLVSFTNYYMKNILKEEHILCGVKF